MISWRLRPMLCNRAVCPNSQSMDWTIIKMKKKESFSVAMLGSYSCSNPSTETPYDSGYLNQNETRKGSRERFVAVHPDKRKKNHELRTIAPGNTTADTEGGAKWTAEGGRRRLTRSRGGISLRAKRVGGSFCGDLDLRSWCWRLILLGLPFFAVYSEERRGCTCVYGLLGFVWLATPLVSWTHGISARSGLDSFCGNNL